MCLTVNDSICAFNKTETGLAWEKREYNAGLVSLYWACFFMDVNILTDALDRETTGPLITGLKRHLSHTKANVC